MGAAPECRGSKGGGEDIDDDGDPLLGALGNSSWWPPGFRFHPTDEELVLYYLKRKVFHRRIRLPMIGDVDVYKWEPWELPEKSVLRSGDKQWYFFSPRDRKYPNGSRSNRATKCGYWKATGKDRTISQSSRAVGNKKTLVYYSGRPPKGQRTDWVMHEYTLDEQVLMSCSNVQDSYALYKVFRKSGPGPKNGEQYGAPFREEQWNFDEDDPDDTLRNNDQRVDTVSHHLHSDSVATVSCNDVNALPIDDLEDLLLQISSDQVVTQWQSGCSTYAPKVVGEAEVGSHIVGQSYVDAAAAKQSGGWYEQDCIDTDFHIHQSAPVYTQPIETPEVTSLTNCSEQGHLIIDEEEFLEIRDFNDPESPVWSTDEINHNDHIHETDQFYDPYDYFDADMYLAEAMGPLDGTNANTQLYFDDYETQNQASHITSELWTHEQVFNVSAAVDSRQVAMAPPASGAVCDSSLSNLGEDTLGQISHAGSESESWFNSTLSALLESIPSRPAIASENALLSRALERVSSFKAGQIGARGSNTTTGGGAAVGRRQGGHNSGFLFLSFLVGLGAILWVLTIGATVKVLKGFWTRYVTS